MKKFLKKLLCISLAMLMVMFCFIGCGEEITGGDDDDESEETSEDKKDNGNPADNLAVGFEVKDVEALLSLLGAEEKIDIKDFKADFTAGKYGTYTAAIAAKLFGEEHNIKLFGGAQDLAVSSTLLDKPYGIGDFARFAENFAFADDSAQGSSSVIGALGSIDAGKLVKFAEKYYNMLITELKTNGGLAATTDNGITTLKGKLSTDNAAVIFVNILEELCADDDFYTLFIGMDNKDNFLNGKPSKAELTSQLKQQLGETDLDITVNSFKFDADNMIKAIDVKVSIQGIVAAVALDLDNATFNFNLTEGTNFIKASYANKKLEAEVNYTTTDIIGDATYTNSIKGNLSIDENGASASFKTIEADDETWYGTRTQDNNVSDFTFEMDKSKLNLKFNSVNETKASGEENYTQKDTESISLNMTYGERGGELTFEQSESYSHSKYPEDNYSDSQKISVKLDITDDGMNLELKQDNNTIALNIKDTDTAVVGTLSENGKEVANVKVDKKVEGTKTTYTLNSLTANNTTTDFSNIGISFYIDTAATMEGLSSYTVIDEMTEDQLQEIANGILTRNEALFNKFADAFEGLGGSSTNGSASDNIPAERNEHVAVSPSLSADETLIPRIAA